MLTIQPEIFKTFPGIQVGFLIVNNLRNSTPVSVIEQMLRSEEAKQAELLKDVELPKLPEIGAWRVIYKKFGSDPKDHRSSIESLLRRARAGNKPLPIINPLVDLYNYISLKYHLPIGAEDLDKIEGLVELAFADGTEGGVCIGSSEDETCYKGEVIYRDKKGFLCRRWNWREADRTKIDHETTRAIVVIERVAEVPEKTLSDALNELTQHLNSLLSADVESYIRP